MIAQAGLRVGLTGPVAHDEMSRRARNLVLSRFGHRVAAKAFEAICQRALAA